MQFYSFVKNGRFRVSFSGSWEQQSFRVWPGSPTHSRLHSGKEGHLQSVTFRGHWIFRVFQRVHEMPCTGHRQILDLQGVPGNSAALARDCTDNCPQRAPWARTLVPDQAYICTSECGREKEGSLRTLVQGESSVLPLCPRPGLGGWKQPPSGTVDRLSATPSFPGSEYIVPPPPRQPSRLGL